MNPSGIVAAGRFHSLVVVPEGDVYQFGNAGAGISRREPAIISGLPPIISVAAGNYFSHFVDPDGNVWGMGDSNYGELGFVGSCAEPQQIKFEEDVKIKMTAASCNYYSVFLDEDGSVWTCGYNGYGQLGLGHLEKCSTPSKIENIPKICSISAGYYHTLLLDENGEVWTCGYNTYGQLGRPTEIEVTGEVVKMPSPVKFKAVSAGNFHSMFLDVEGRVWGCGHNYNASLALPHTDTPKSVEMWQEKAKIGFISAGYYRTLLIDKEGDVWYAGDAFQQQEEVGYPPHFVRKIPQIPSEGYAASCESHHLVVGAGGQVWVWGDNKYGQLGLGSGSLFESEPVVNNLLPPIRMFHRTKSARN